MTPHIPKGWRKLKFGFVIKPLDKFWNYDNEKWEHSVYSGHKVGSLLLRGNTYIRRIKKGKKR